ncbi:phospholipase/carboxylesterase family protein [Listeria monocytogenes]|uniref:alpha/beta hydrolase n=1 Tax=Listeria monocytogenes TaxID=1639 RepID=UPI000A1D5421|nr:alpha/beta hydrolase [Listeria monocytogenes]ARM72229.1 phospholipase/carboxylesterase family protein [Listeria monocytogenes]
MRTYTYDIYEPIGRKETDKFPVIFALHGFGGDELDMAGHLEILMDRFVVVSMRGDVEYGPSFGFYHMVLEGDPNAHEIDYTSSRVVQFINNVCEEYHSIDKTNIFLAGFDQGAILATSLMANYGGQYKAAAILSGRLPSYIEEQPVNLLLKGKRIFIGHGIEDAVFQLAEAEKLVKFFKKINCNVEKHSYFIGHNVNEAEEDDLYRWFESFLPNQPVKNK